MSKLSTGKYEKYGVSYDTLTLSDGAYSFTIVPCKGGMAISLKNGDDEYLWLRDKNFESFERTRCGIPVLFPSCGMPDNGVHNFNGTNYPMENHGFAGLLPWSVKEANDEKIVLELLPNGLTRFVYPFDYKATLEYTLKGNRAGIKMNVENIGSNDMPYSVGFHPYFYATKLDNISFDIKAETCAPGFIKGEQPKLEGEVTLPHGDVQSTRVLKGVKSPMVLKDSGNGHVVEVDFDDNFVNAVLWEQEAESFVCMEPWNGFANSLNDDCHETCKPGESKDFTWGITIK